MQKEFSNHTGILGQQDIVQAIKDNDDLVLKHLYNKNFYKIEQFILKNQGSSAQAKDIYQEAFIAMWNNIRADKFHPNGESAIDGYLYSIARNKWTDYLRSGHFRKMVPSSQENNLEHGSWETEEGSEADEPKLKTTMEAFGKLGPDCKSLLTRFYFDKKPLKQLAEELKLGTASVRNKKYRCMQKLRELAFEQQKNNGGPETKHR